VGNTVGTLRKATFSGVTYDVMADTNISFKNSKFETEGVATTGKTLMKMTKRVKNVESLDLGVTPQEMEDIKSLSESLADIPMSFELADGSVFRGSGRINFDTYESETGKLSIGLIPNGDWTSFIA
jgi:hypothetical protein